MAQNIQQAAEQERIERERQEQLVRDALRQQQAAEAQRLQDYQNAIASAERYTEAQQYAMALHYYHRAREIRPENAVQINARIAEINNRIQQAETDRLAAVRSQHYQQAIVTAQSHYAQRHFYQAIQSYRVALEIKPENAVQINARIRAITDRMNEPALLRIYRPRGGGLGGVLGRVGDAVSVRFDILFENTVVGRGTTTDWNTTVPITTFGTQTLSATIDGRRAELQINIQPGGVYYVRAGHTSQTRNTGETRTHTNRRTGATETTQVTETLHTPTLQLVDSSIGSAEFNAVGTGRNRR